MPALSEELEGFCGAAAEPRSNHSKLHGSQQTHERRYREPATPHYLSLL